MEVADITHNEYVEEGLLGYTRVLDVHGPAGLDFLNARVAHRFTGVYQLVSGVLHNTYLHDKQGEIIPEFLQAVPLADSFCQFVLRDGLFCTVNTALDGRLDGHKYQGVLGSYHGVPLLNNAGELYGTLCHFDESNHPLTDAEFAFMQKAAQRLPRYLFRRATTAAL